MRKPRQIVRPPPPKCPICGSHAFSFGGLARAPGSLPPLCEGCKSVERHRIIHAAYQPLRPLLRTWRAFQFAPDPSVRAEWFASYDSSTYHGSGVDMMNTPFENGAFDVVISNHVLEHVADDRLALAEQFRVVGPEGVVHLCVPNTMWRWDTRDWGFADPKQNEHYREYGADFPMMASWAAGEALCIGVLGQDSVTGVYDCFYFLSRRPKRLELIGNTLQRNKIPVVRFW